VFPFPAELRTLFLALDQEREDQRKAVTICPLVFQRNGRRVKQLRAVEGRVSEGRAPGAALS
jgi:hypothetical protein